MDYKGEGLKKSFLERYVRRNGRNGDILECIMAGMVGWINIVL